MGEQEHHVFADFSEKFRQTDGVENSDGNVCVIAISKTVFRDFTQVSDELSLENDSCLRYLLYLHKRYTNVLDTSSQTPTKDIRHISLIPLRRIHAKFNVSTASRPTHNKASGRITGPPISMPAGHVQAARPMNTLNLSIEPGEPLTGVDKCINTSPRERGSLIISDINDCQDSGTSNISPKHFTLSSTVDIVNNDVNNHMNPSLNSVTSPSDDWSHASTQRTRFGCRMCSRDFTDRHKLERHERTHMKNRIKRFRCQVCAYATDYTSDLVRHNRIHTGEKCYKCEYCSFATAWKKNLKNHTKTHTDKMYRCEKCPISVSSIQELHEHALTHSDDQESLSRPIKRARYECDMCNFNSYSLADMNEHKIDIHDLRHHHAAHVNDYDAHGVTTIDDIHGSDGKNENANDFDTTKIQIKQEVLSSDPDAEVVSIEPPIEAVNLSNKQLISNFRTRNDWSWHRPNETREYYYQQKYNERSESKSSNNTSSDYDGGQPLYLFLENQIL